MLLVMNRQTPRREFPWRGFLLSLLHVRPGEWRWRVSIEAAVTVGIPLLLFTMVGAPELGLMSSLGAFTVIYFNDRPRRERLAAQTPVALVLWASAGLGVAAAASMPWTVTALIFLSVLACWLVLGFRIGPPGPLMLVLVAGVAGHIAAPVQLGGSGVSGWIVLAMVGIGCLTSLLVAAVPLLLQPGQYRTDSAPQLRRIYGRLEFDAERTRIMQRVVLAALISALVSYSLGVPRAYWVILTCIAILQSHPQVSYTVARAVQRSLGTLLGVGAFWVVASLNPQGLWLVLVICLLQLLIELFITRNYALGLLFITPLALTITTVSSGAPAGQIISLRIMDTVLGSIIALLVLFGLEWWHSWRTRRRLQA